MAGPRHLAELFEEGAGSRPEGVGEGDFGPSSGGLVVDIAGFTLVAVLTQDESLGAELDAIGFPGFFGEVRHAAPFRIDGGHALAVFLDEPATELDDTILHPLFRYAFLKGLASARFGDDVGSRLAADLWLRMMPPAVDVLERQAAALGVPLPRHDVDEIIAIGDHPSLTL